jgi:hypothetical protein
MTLCGEKVNFSLKIDFLGLILFRIGTDSETKWLSRPDCAILKEKQGIEQDPDYETCTGHGGLRYVSGAGGCAG